MRTSAGNGTATTTYGYDHTDQRVRKKTSTATTTYPTKYFEKESRTIGATTTSTTTAYVFQGNDLAAMACVRVHAIEFARLDQRMRQFR